MPFQKVVLIYNPASGQKHARRAAQIDAVVAALRQAGVEAQTLPTRGPGTAGAQALEAIGLGADVVFACGGDGTVHEVLQGIAGSNAVLGVVPLGTANSLAAELGLPRDPAAAARALLQAEAACVALGRIEYRDRSGNVASRYFTVTGGVGADAHLAYELTAGFKQRYGMVSYYIVGARMLLRHHFPLFEVEFTTATGERRCERVSQLLAARLADFGGLLARLAPGAALRRNVLRLVLFKTQSRLRYLQYVSRVVLRSSPASPFVELVDAVAVLCRPIDAARIYVEADGELLGHLPASMEVVSDGVTLLMPSRASQPKLRHSMQQ